MKRILKLLACADFAMLTGLAGANPGALEINQDCAAVGCFAGDTAGFPVSITQSGSYVLTSDLNLNGVSASAAIDISSTVSELDIDLNGHTIDGGGTCTGDPTVTACSGSTGNTNGITSLYTSPPMVVHIHGGTIRGFGGNGIVIYNTDDGTVLEHLTLTQNSGGVVLDGARTSATVRVLNSQIVRNLYGGVTKAFSGGQTQIENCTIAGNGGFAALATTSGIFVGNRFSNNGSGLVCSGTCAIGQNTFVGNGGTGNQYGMGGTAIDMGGNVCLDHTTTAPPGKCP